MRAAASWIALGSIFLACASSNRAERLHVASSAAPTVTSAPYSGQAMAAPETPKRDSAIPSTIAELQRAALGSTGASDAVRSLTTEVGPRLAGSPGDRAAVAWAQRAMEARGLTNVHAEPVTVAHWERGVETASIVAPYAHKLAVTALGGSVSTPPGGIEGEIVRLDSLDALVAIDAKEVAGKIVFIDRVMRRTKDGKGYGETVGARSRGSIEAAKKGALALLIRSIGTDHERLPHTGAQRRDKSGHAIPAASLSVPDAELLAEVVAAASPKRARVSLTIGAHWLPDTQSANVIGEVRGRELPDDVVLLGAHLDSWDLGTGAIDDGAGCGIVLEAGRLLAALPQKPRRTVRIVLFAAEENSLGGGLGYAKAHAHDAAHHVVALEADSGTDRAYVARYLGAPNERARFTAFSPWLAPLEIATDATPAAGGADLGPLRALGVPVIDLEQDMSRYFDLHHTANDTFDKIDPPALAQVAAAFATMADAIAEMDGDFGRIPEGSRVDAN